MSVNLGVRDKHIALRFLQDYDNNYYSTIIINNQEWIVENLRVTHYADGTSIPELSVNADWIAEDGTSGHNGAICFYDNDSSTYKEKYGALYNWYAVNNSHILPYFKRGGVQEIGWRIPTETDYTNLMLFIDSDGTALSNTAGGDLKEIGLTYWNTPNDSAIDAYGFRGRGAGARTFSTGSYAELGDACRFFSSTEYDIDYAAAVSLSNSTDVFTVSFGATRPHANKSNGYSVRCVRDLS